MRERFSDREGVACALATRLSAAEAEACQALRQAHCVQGHTGPECQGRLILDRNGLTAACPRCGDARALYRRAEHG